MTCEGINSTLTLYVKIIEEQNRRVHRMFILNLLLIGIIMIQMFYFVYDRQLDGQFEIDATATEIIQDGKGYNSYIDGIGDIINGAEGKENNN